jgi:cysteine synthase A
MTGGRGEGTGRGDDRGRVGEGWDANRRLHDTILEATGHTPLVRLRRLAPEGVELLAKVEWYGPTGSVKDRIYRRMLERAEERGDLRSGMTIIECTTGNAGIACSAVAAVKGYACTIVMPEGMSAERKAMIRAYGAELVLTPGAGTDIELAFARMREIVDADPDRYFFPAEFENPDNPEAQLVTGEEIWEQVDGRLDAVVAAQGTGGWITGVARALRAHDSNVKMYAVEPAECPLISSERWGTHGVPGIGDGIIPGNLDLALMDGVVTASTREALDTAARLARDEGLLCGPSSGINVAAALKVSAMHPEFARIVTVIPDTGQRYLSGELFGEGEEVEPTERDHTIDAETRARVAAHRDRLEFIS